MRERAGPVSVVRQSAVVPYTAAEMYALINDVEAYPQFLPWCSAAQVHERAVDRLRASVSLAVGRIRQTFSTQNTMQPDRRIDVHLVSGPFRSLEGFWEFEPLDERSCRIRMEMDFEFRNAAVRLLLGTLFNHIVGTLINAFRERAEQVYGRR
jgi:ribosome-associated toxin RatA of RatAB toxin-antitoxin module